MDVFLCTGERSGDVMAAALTRELRARAGRSLRMAALAGPMVAEAGAEGFVDGDAADLAMVGVDSGRLKAWTRRLAVVAEQLRRDPPKVFVGITHCTFNLALAPMLPEQTRRVLIGPPEIWAWRTSGLANLLEKIGSLVAWFHHDPLTWLKGMWITTHRDTIPVDEFDELLCLLPMNARAHAHMARHRPARARVRWIGHPLADLHRDADRRRRAAELRRSLGVPPDAHLLAVFPGSRRSTMELLLEPMLQAVEPILNERRDVYAAVSLAGPSLEPFARGRLALAVEQLDRPGQLQASLADASDLLAAASHAVLSSGTITLQAACLGTPGTVAYDMRHRTLIPMLARRSREYGRPIPMGLPNAIRLAHGAEDWVYPELLGHEMTPARLRSAVAAALPDGPYDADHPPMLPADVVADVRRALRPVGGASFAEAAAEIVLGHVGDPA